MIQKKICMLGAFAVGKTSLVQRFVSGIFSEKYHTTVGVKIDKKTVTVDEQEITLILWDLHGEDEFQKIRASYLRGSAGYLLVVDGTRRKTLEVANSLHTMARETLGDVPYVVLVNKSDLVSKWEIGQEDLDKTFSGDKIILNASAKTGEGVENAFLTLAQSLTET